VSGSYFSSDTIAAVATSLAGDGGVGIIRISGRQALDATNMVVKGIDANRPRYLTRVEVIDPASQEVMDDGLGVFFPQGQSFTGEDVIELQLHGGRFLLQNILRFLIETGKCRLALPGEFSFRAVRNGKLTLSGASAIGQIISAKSTFEVQAARRQLSAARMERFEELAKKIRNLLAQSELSIDFIDQDVEVISPTGMREAIQDCLQITNLLLEEMTAARRIARGLQVTLVGEPNAGKSTLFNALLSEDRAIVSPEAGTTRDVITEEFSLGPYRIRLADTAGLRTTEGMIEREGISRATELLAASDLVVLVVDCTSELNGLREVIKKFTGSTEVELVAANKIDAIPPVKRVDILGAVSKEFSGKVIPISASEGQGVSTMFEEIRAALDKKVGLGLSTFLPTEFQMQMLLSCRRELDQLIELIAKTELKHPELVSAGLVSAVKALTDLVGETTPDTVLTQIFSEFCIGK